MPWERKPEPDTPAPVVGRHVFAGDDLYAPAVRFMVDVYVDLDGNIVGAALSRSYEGGAWTPAVATLVPAPGADPTTGRVPDEAPC